MSALTTIEAFAFENEYFLTAFFIFAIAEILFSLSEHAIILVCRSRSYFCNPSIQRQQENSRTSVYSCIQVLYTKEARGLTFSQMAQTLHKYRSSKGEDTATCVKVLIDALLDETAVDLEQDEINPMYSKSKATLQAIYNGRRSISRTDAGIINTRVDEAHFADFISESLSFDALQQLSFDMHQYGFDASVDSVAGVCANIMVQLINRIAEGREADVQTLTIEKKENGKRIKNVAPATIERKGDKLRICGEEIIICKELILDDDERKGLRCFQAVCDAYADALKIGHITEADIPELPREYQDDFADQRECYFSAESIQHSIRDTFDDGADEFDILKKDAWQGINMTYRKKYDNGYDRLIAVLEKITSTTLDLSALSQIRNLIGNMDVFAKM